MTLDEERWAAFMTGGDLRNARKRRGWTQEQAAKKLGMTQAYLSMLESGRRALSRPATARVLRRLDIPPTALPLQEELNWSASPNDLLRDEFAALGYPGFSYLHRNRAVRHNPAQVLFTALNEPDLDMRVVEGLPWLAFTFTDLDWDWLVRNCMTARIAWGLRLRWRKNWRRRPRTKTDQRVFLITRVCSNHPYSPRKTRTATIP